MLPTLICTVFSIIGFFICFLLLKKKRILVRILVSIGVALVFGLATDVLNVTGLFTFSSPEQASRFCQNGRIEEVIEGDNTCMIITSIGSKKQSIRVFYKTEKGYRAAKVNALHLYYAKDLADDYMGNVFFYREKKTGDKYVEVWYFTKDSFSQAEDSCGNQLTPYPAGEYHGADKYRFFAYADCDPDDYKIFIDGNPIEYK
ncbi:MAG: hypothetical protein II124_01170 [Clostridia bacterium]|nr:hypothetical protein [Clostridia bacterium]